MTLTAITALLTQFAMLCNPTPAVEVLTLYESMMREWQQYIVERQLYIDESDICRGEYREEMWFLFWWEKVYCPDVVSHFEERKMKIGNDAMKFSWLCQQFFTTSNSEECVEKAYEELTQLIEQ